jgi:hypothetical protein
MRFTILPHRIDISEPAPKSELPTATWSELRYGLFGQLEDHDGEPAQA